MLKVIKRSVPVVATLAVLILGAICDRASSAMQQKSDFVVRVNNSLSLIVPKQDILLMLNPNNSVLVSDSVNVEVRTNNKNGATVFVSTNKNSGKVNATYSSGYENATALVGRNTKKTIQTISGNFNTSMPEDGFSTEFFPKGYWGVSADGEHYVSVGEKRNPTELYSVEMSGQSDKREVFVGARASDDLLSDYYENTIVFTAVATYSPKTVKDIVFMQEIDDEVADSMMTNAQYQLRDMRDNKKYWVAKLADGNIWMTQNLDLELSTIATLTPKDTDISADWTPTRGTIEATQSTNDNWENNGTTPYSYGAINKDSRTEVLGYINSPTTPDIVEGRYAFPFGTYKTQEECAASVSNSDYCEHYNVGKYYNWAATIATNDASAIANTGETTTVEQSICPAKWRLPTGSSGNYIKGEFANLLEKANVATNVTSESGETTGYYTSNTSNALVSTPLFFTNAGTKSKGQNIEHAYGEYWTSSIHNEPNVDRFAFDRHSESGQNELKTNFYPNVSNINADLGTGRSIRCVARGMYTHALGYYIGDNLIGRQEVKNAAANYNMIFDPSKYTSGANTIIGEKSYIGGWAYHCPSNDPYASDMEYSIVPGEYISVGSTECKAKATALEGQRVDFYGNGGTFDDSSDDNVVILSKAQRNIGSLSYGNSTTRKSSSYENGYYGSKDIVTLDFGDSRYVDVTLKYGLYNSSDKLCIISGYYWENPDRYYETEPQCTYSYSGRVSTRTTSFRINSNIITIYFKPYSSNYNYFGYWADFSPENGLSHAIRAGSVKIPSRAGYKFLGWSTDQYATSADFEFDPGNNTYSDDLKLYAVWGEDVPDTHSLIVSADKNVTGMTIKQGSMSGSTIAGDRHGSMFVFSGLAEGANYYLVPEFASGFEFDNWRRVDSVNGASLSATDNQNAYFTIGEGDSAVILTSKRGLLSIQNFDCNSLSNVGDTAELVDVRDGSAYTVKKLSDGKCWMMNNLRLDFSKLKEDITALNTNNPTPVFAEIANTRPGQTSFWCTTSDSNCVDKVKYSTANIGDMTTDSYGHNYDEYGVYYNWHTVTAGHGLSSSGAGFVADGDICPSGWHLPAYNELAAFGNMTQTAYGNNGGTASRDYWTGTQGYLYSGYVYSGSINRGNSDGYYWTSSINNDYPERVSVLYIVNSYYVGVRKSDFDKSYGATARCVANQTINISYRLNGGEGGVSPQLRIAKGDSVTLDYLVPRRYGYAFTGWNTSYDGSGVAYLPDQTITAPNEDLVLYAQWAAPSGTMQGFDCSTLKSGEVVALRDTRDDSIYPVAKLADGKCWTTENLRLDFHNLKEDISASNTNNPSAAFMTTVNARPASTTTEWCNSYYSSDCVDQVLYDASPLGNFEFDQKGNTYDRYGVHYNWHTATAGHGKVSSHNIVTPGDICPAGWHLPTGDIGATTGEITALKNLVGVDKMKTFPVNFIGSGLRANSNSVVGTDGRGGYYWTSSALGDCCSYDAEFSIDYDDNTFTFRVSNTYKTSGGTVRCVKN